jgi:hypothetical protein
VEFIPQLMVTGGYVITPEMQTGGRVAEAKLVSIYGEVRDAGFPYQAFQLDLDGSGAVMQAQPPGEVVTIKPPLIQVQSVLREGTVETGGRKAQDIASIITRVLGVPQIAQLGIRVIYHAPLPSNDAKDFILNRLLSFGGEHLGDLSMGGDLWGGVKYVVGHPDGQYTVNVEPAVADQMRSLYIEIDAQFPGTYAPSAILDKAAQVKEYVTGRVGSYLDKIAGN